MFLHLILSGPKFRLGILFLVHEPKFEILMRFHDCVIYLYFRIRGTIFHL